MPPRYFINIFSYAKLQGYLSVVKSLNVSDKAVDPNEIIKKDLVKRLSWVTPEKLLRLVVPEKLLN